MRIYATIRAANVENSVTQYSVFLPDHTTTLDQQKIHRSTKGKDPVCLPPTKSHVHQTQTMTDQKRYTNKLHNSRVLLIGGTSGLGYSVAEACLENGALVTISSSNPSRIDAAVSKLKTAYPSAADPKHPRVWGLAVDLGKPETLEQELKTLLEKTVGNLPEGRLDHVVFTAGDRLAEIELKDMVC
jgi:hypothetical protein